MDSFTKAVENTSLGTESTPTTREEAAKRAFQELLQKCHDGQQLFEEDILQQHVYADITDCDKAEQWETELGYKISGLEMTCGRLELRFAILPTHYQLACLFADLYYEQLTDKWTAQGPPDEGWFYFPLSCWQSSEGVGFPKHLLPSTIKEPCAPTRSLDINASFGPWSREKKQIWPTIILDVAFQSEDMATLLARRDYYLSHNTGVNVWIGVQYCKENGTWWMSVAHRDFTAVRQPEQQVQDNWPPSIWLYQLGNGQYEPLTTPRNEVWDIPMEMLFYPDPVQVLEPPLPGYFRLEVERFRERIVNPTEEGPMRLDYPEDEEAMELDYSEDEEENEKHCIKSWNELC